MQHARTNPRLLVRYLHWGIYVGIATPLVMTVVALSGRPDPRGVGAVAALTIGVALLELTAWWVIRQLNSPHPLSGKERRWAAAAGTAYLLVIIAQRLIFGPGDGWTPAVFWLLIMTCSVLGMLLRLWQAALLAVTGGLSGVGLAILGRGITQDGGFQAGLWIVLGPIVVITWWTSGWMLRVMADLEEAREAAAWAAASDERARISRDLHDLFGQTMAAIAVKSELAAALAERGRHDEAAAEMRAVHRLADESGGRVRAVVRGERAVDLAAELSGARALLGSAQVYCEVDAEPVDPADASTLAWVLREAVTNVLRHSSARTVRIEVASSDQRVMLRVANDRPGAGVNDQLGAGEGFVEGGGLRGMRERLTSVGGTLKVTTEPDRFVVEAIVPARTVDGAQPGPVVDVEGVR